MARIFQSHELLKFSEGGRGLLWRWTMPRDDVQCLWSGNRQAARTEGLHPSVPRASCSEDGYDLLKDRYCRIYWAVMDDPKFDGIREDMRHFGSWSLLLLTADMAWPASAYVPPTVPKASLAALIACGLIDPLSGSRYRVHGLDAEREARSENARNAAALRWHKAGNAESMRSHDLSNAESMPSRSEQEQEQRRTPPTPRMVAHRWLKDHGAAAPVGWVNTTLNELVKVYGIDRVVALWNQAPADVKTSKQYVQLAERQLAPDSRNGFSAPGAKPGSQAGDPRHAQDMEAVERAFNR